MTEPPKFMTRIVAKLSTDMIRIKTQEVFHENLENSTISRNHPILRGVIQKVTLDFDEKEILSPTFSKFSIDLL